MEWVGEKNGEQGGGCLLRCKNKCPESVDNPLPYVLYVGQSEVACGA